MKHWFYLILSILFILAPAQPAVSSEPPKQDVLRESTSTPQYLNGVPLTDGQIALKQAVAAAFASKPVMVAIAGCESSYRQFNGHGEPLVSKTDDVGVMQINLPTWKKQAKLLDLNISSSSEDNIKMAQYILDQQGVKAWDCSKKVK